MFTILLDICLLIAFWLWKERYFFLCQNFQILIIVKFFFLFTIITFFKLQSYDILNGFRTLTPWAL